MDDPYYAVRGGLGDLPARLRTRPCTIAYFGASIAVQQEGYRPRLHEWLLRSSGLPHRAVNAAMGALGSVSAVFNLDELVLRHHPDLCFVEYSSGDIAAQSPPAQLGPAVQGIVRKLLDAECQPVFLHAYRHDRRFEPPDFVIATHERIADYYGIPSICAGREIERALGAGTMAMNDLSIDGIHTTPRGSERLSALLTGALDQMLSSPAQGQHCFTRRAAPPLYERDYRHTRVLPADASMLRRPDRHTRGTLRFHFPYLQFGTDNQLEVAIDAEVAGVAVVIGRDSGAVRVRTPTGEREIMLWDRDCFYNRYSTILFDPPLAPGTPLSVALTDTPVNYAQCARPLGDTSAIRKQLKVIGFLLRE